MKGAPVKHRAPSLDEIPVREVARMIGRSHQWYNTALWRDLPTQRRVRPGMRGGVIRTISRADLPRVLEYYRAKKASPVFPDDWHTCTECGEEWPLSAFSFSRSQFRWRKRPCNDCFLQQYHRVRMTCGCGRETYQWKLRASTRPYACRPCARANRLRVKS